MLVLERLNLISLRMFCLLFLFLVSTTQARATDALPISIYGGFTPYSKVPENYSDSGGTGMSLGIFAAPFGSWNHGIEVTAASQGKASFLSAEYRRYVSGVAQYTQSSHGLAAKLRQKGWFFQFGVVTYELYRTDVVTLVSDTVSGVGLTLGCGWEVPIWGSVYASPRVGYTTSITAGSFNGVYVKMMIGVPITFY